MLFKRDKHSNLKLILRRLYPNHKITITDNKDGSQTITLLWLIRLTMYQQVHKLPLISIINVFKNVYELFIKSSISYSRIVSLCHY